MPEGKKKIWLWAMLILAVLVIAILVIWLVFIREPKTDSANQSDTTTSQTGDSENNELTLYPCESSSSTPVESVSGFKTEMYLSEVDKSGVSTGKELAKKSLSLADLAASPRTEDVIYHAYTPDESFMPGAIMGLEVCNKDGKKEFSWSFKDNSPASDNTLGMTYYISGGYAPSQPGTYTVYGWFKAPNTDKWVLTNKQEVTFIE